MFAESALTFKRAMKVGHVGFGCAFGENFPCIGKSGPFYMCNLELLQTYLKACYALSLYLTLQM